MREGKLVPTEVTVRLLSAAMQGSPATRFLIDGFPRALDQAEGFERDVKAPDLVIFLDCPQARATYRPPCIDLARALALAAGTGATPGANVPLHW